MQKEVKHYISEVQKKFPQFSESELNKIITFGLKMYAWANKMHADVLIHNKVGENFTAHCGYLGYDTLQHYLRWVTKWRMKERVLYRLRKTQWDGYYYIGLNEEDHKKILKQRKRKKFTNVYLTKIKRELYHNKLVKHIWRVPYPADCGWKFFLTKFETEYAEYIGENQYGKYHQCFYGRDNIGYASVDNLGDLAD